MGNFTANNGNSSGIGFVIQPTIELFGPNPCTFSCGQLNANIVVNKAGGTVTNASSFTYGTAVGAPYSFILTSGTFNHGPYTTTLGSSTLFSTPGVNWNNITVPAGVTVTINQPLNITGTLALGGTITFNGTHGWTCGTLTCSTAGSIITLQQAVTYTTTNSVTMLGTSASRILMKTSDIIPPIVLAKWTLTNTPAAQSMTYVSATAIDSSAGMTIWSFQGTTNGIDALTQNWGAGSPQLTKSFTFVC